MKRKTLGVLALATLFIMIMVGMGQAEANAAPDGVVGVDSITHTSPSDQHYDANSYFYCGATRPATDYTVQYDWPYHLSAEYVGYTCIAHNHGASSGGTRWVCSWTVQVWWNGWVTYPDESKHCSVW